MKILNVIFYQKPHVDRKHKFTHCRKCGIAFIVGEKIVSKKACRVRRYHYDCAVLVNLSPELHDNTELRNL
jgi:hypothetical protein